MTFWGKKHVQKLTDHLNQVDSTDSIRFTHEEEKDGKIPFLDTLIICKPNGAIKLLVYRKPMPTNIKISSQNTPSIKNMGVIRTVFLIKWTWLEQKKRIF